MGLASLPKITVLGMDNQYLLADSFACADFGLNSRYVISIEAVSLYFLDIKNFERVKINLISEQVEAVYHGFFISCRQILERNGRFRLVLRFGCSLHYLDNFSYQHVFVNKTVEEIIHTVLAKYNIDAKFEFSHTTARLKYIEQGHVSDYDFLLRLCVEYGVIFYYRQISTNEILYFTDDIKHKKKHCLTFNLANRMVESGPSVTAVQYCQVKLPDEVKFKSVADMSPSITWKAASKNKTKINGYGTLYLSDYYTCSSEVECQEQANRLQQQLDWQREWLLIDARKILAQPGDIIKIKGHPNDYVSSSFQVYDVGVTLSISEANQHLIHQKIILISMAHHYRMPDIATKAQWNGRYNEVLPVVDLYIGEIVENADDCILDEFGLYAVSPLLFGQQDSIFKARLLQPAAGPIHNDVCGMHMPLPAQTKVVVAHLENKVDMPIIIGVLPGSNQKSSVVASNSEQLVLRHHNGSAIIFDDSKSEQNIDLHTEESENGLRFEKIEKNEKITGVSRGEMKFCSKSMTEVISGRDIGMYSQRSELVADGCVALGAKNELNITSGADIQYNTGNDWLVQESVGELILAGVGDVEMSGRQVSIKSSSVQLKSSLGNIHGNLAAKISAVNGIALSVGSTYCNISSLGINFHALNLEIKAKQVIKNRGAAVNTKS